MSVSLGREDMLCAPEVEKERPIPLGSRTSGNAALEATHHNCRCTRFPIRAFALKGEDSCGNSWG